MALIKCKECQAEISSDAKSCPHCGKRVPHVDAKNVITVIVGCLVIWGGYHLLSGDDSDRSTTPAIQPAPGSPPSKAGEATIPGSASSTDTRGIGAPSSPATETSRQPAPTAAVRYRPVSVRDFLIDGADLATAGTKVELTGVYILVGNVGLLYPD